jgi:D-tyrosyl-tRNA(Tyr) deacylase
VITIVQRVSKASVDVPAEGYSASIAHGLCVLLCVEQGDDEASATWMAGKLARLRIFTDSGGKMNRSAQDVGGAVLLVSQFTLAGDCSKGNRPSFVAAAPPEVGERLCERVANLLRAEHNLDVKTGRFGATMHVSLVNEGPVTLIVRSPSR